MRRLLVKLVALETALVGWLAYWLFLVYADNPSVAEGLAAQLSKFPQLAFTTVDISVLVIIGVLSLFLAFKFQRGLKPGIRLERALQMLENLMKRNLILESQVAEMKLEKVQVPLTPPISTSQPVGESRLGSWERAFRTPIEAGLPSSTQSTRSPESSPLELGSDHEASHRSAPRFEPKPIPQTIVGSKTVYPTIGKKPERIATLPSNIIEKSPTSTTSAAGPATWEDSPKYLGESGGFLTPSPTPRRQIASPEPEAARQPYIPAPPPPRLMPSSVILGPGISPIPQARPTARPSTAPRIPQKAPLVLPTPPPTSPTPTDADSKPPVQEPFSGPTQQVDALKPVISEKNPSDNSTKSMIPDASSSFPASSQTLSTKNEPKSSGRPKKRFNWEDE